MLGLLAIALAATILPAVSGRPSPPNPPNPPNHPVAAASVAIRGGVYWRTDPRFKSWNIDASENRGWEVRNLSLPKLRYLAAASLPGYIRFGGTGNDLLVYGVGNISKCDSRSPKMKDADGALKPKPKHHCLNETHFDAFMGFVSASTAKLIFGLNIQPRTELGNWDPTEARALLAYGRRHFGDDAFFGFELGNEKDQVHTAEQVVTDFGILRELIDEIWGDVSSDARPRLIGPDPHGFHSAPMRDEDLAKLRYLERFAVAAAKASLPIYALTHHEYVEITQDNVHPPAAETLDYVGGIAAQVNATLRGTAGVPTSTLIFAGETGPHNGKSPGILSDKSMRWANFADVFWYLDAMGSKAMHGYSAFCRQDFVGIDYGMLDPQTNEPLPDFYAGILWSRLMGTGVIRATSSVSGTVRVYAHCTPDAPNAAGSSNGALSVMLLNLASPGTPTTAVSLQGVHGCGAASCARTEWRLSGPKGTNSTAIALNGRVLSLDGSGRVPELRGNKVPGKEVRGISGADVGISEQEGGAARLGTPHAPPQHVIKLPGATVAFLRFEGAGHSLGCR